MRTFLWTEQYWPYIGGVEVLSTRLAGALRRRGHEVVVVTGHGSLELPEEQEHDGVRIHRFPFYDALSTGNIEQLLETRMRVAALKKKLRPQLVHVTIIAPSVFFHLQTAAAHPCPLLVTHQMSTQTADMAGAETVAGRLLRSADWLTCCARSVLDELTAMVPELTSRSSVVYNGVDVPAVAPAPLPVDAPRLLCLGRLVPEKGLDRAVAALPAILARHPAARLELIGEGPVREALQRQADDLGVSGAVEFSGWVTPEEVPARINAATLLLLPSRTEALPVVALEAALMNRPVVATRVGGVEEVVEHDRTGLVIDDADDPAPLAAAVLSLLDDPARMEALGRTARERVVDGFTFDRYVDEYEQLYDRLITAASSSSAAPAPLST